MEEKTVVQSLAALAQPFRLRVFRALVVAGTSGSTPSVLSEQLAIPSTTLSFHLKELTYSGLVSQEREGRNIVYKAAFEQMTQLMGYLLENCCQGSTSKTCQPTKKQSKGC
jgi:ArsR family transcriptional regulator, arsenate/arsenite/antimonite-responsive transcriptional repressor